MAGEPTAEPAKMEPAADFRLAMVSRDWMREWTTRACWRRSEVVVPVPIWAEAMDLASWTRSPASPRAWSRVDREESAWSRLRLRWLARSIRPLRTAIGEALTASSL